MPPTGVRKGVEAQNKACCDQASHGSSHGRPVKGRGMDVLMNEEGGEGK
jgi:hypothetical protein